ncbi:uncharacterized protein [Periplaneta americana]|uniref:uncharacterized protein isoform X2 n=1 Tax=Periplaneta americana TaxID=6978 RepID=UPI0037E99805
MDAIKIKMEEDPLNIEAIDNTSIEDTKPLPEDGNMFGQDVTGIKTESVDDSYDPTLEEAQEPINVCAVKYEAEEQSFDLVTVKEEVNVGTEPEEDEVLTDSFYLD